MDPNDFHPSRSCNNTLVVSEEVTGDRAWPKNVNGKVAMASSLVYGVIFSCIQKFLNLMIMIIL